MALGYDAWIRATFFVFNGLLGSFRIIELFGLPGEARDETEHFDWAGRNPRRGLISRLL